MPRQQYVYKCPNHVANLNRMRLDSKWCDMIIRVGEREFHAHKVVIAANIKHFDMMLSNESFEESKQGVITMEHIKEADMEALLSYAYTGEILLTDDNALDLLEVANYLGEDGIREACIEFLQTDMKKELACRAYKLAKSIECLALKSAAKTAILANFAHCSQTADYLDFDHEYLTEILADAKGEPAESQHVFFHGIMRWLMHDVSSRKISINELLSAIDTGKLTAEYLTNYLVEHVVGHHDKHGIVSAVMLCYHSLAAGQTLLAIGTNVNKDGLVSFQTYSFTENKWSPLSEESSFPNSRRPTAAILDDKLYYRSQDSLNSNSFLNVFDPATNEHTQLHVSGSVLRGSAMCACSRYLYLCGGINIENGLPSNQVLRYDPLANVTETLAPLTIARSYAAAIFYQGCVHALGGYGSNTMEKYDSNANKWTALAEMREERTGHAAAVLDGKLYACGGLDSSSVEVYDPSTDSWELVASMNEQRARFLLVPRDGRLLAIGGQDAAGNTAEVYNPRKNEWKMDSQLTADMQIQHPQGGMIWPSFEKVR